MRTSAAALELDFTEPSITAAKAVHAVLRKGNGIDRPGLLRMMESAYGSTAADGHWSLRDAYDVLELAQVLHLATLVLPQEPAECLATLIALTASLPTHSVRSEEQIALQQFSTPAAIGYLAALAARITAADTVLEPSAGTGLLAVFAARVGAKLVLNEIDPARAVMLEAAFPTAPVSRHDGEIIHDLLPLSIRPTAVLINPPFSRSMGRHADPLAAFRHLRAALKRLGAGGRCAAILPDRVDTSSRAWTKATDGCAITLHVELPANAYAKHGTSQIVKLIVLEKGSQDDVALIRCSSLAEVLAAISTSATPRCSPVRLAPTRAHGSLLGSLSSRPRLSAPIAKAAPSLGALDISYDVFAEPVPTGEAVGVYLPYRPSRIAIPCASAHPTALVESIAMGSITAPRPSYVPKLPTRVVADRVLSDAQLETLIYAGDAFERDISGLFKAAEEGLSLAPDQDGRPYRTGFFLGDGTGAGKGRQVAAIILDQWLRGRRKHIWISKTETLLEDARRDWTAVGGLALDIQHLNQWKLGTPIGAAEGVLFLTYATLRSNRGDKGTRLQQILDWVGDDFDGMMVFDEAHEMAGVAGGEGRFGTKDGSDQGIAGVRLQNLLPRARVLYVSATGASDVNNLAYATRLGLWGPTTAFADRRAFVDSLRRGGIAAMELIARDLKMQGLYVARALSFAGVEYDILEHRLTPDQVEVYDAYADAWAIIHANLRTALDATRVTDSFSNDAYNSGAKAAALSIFESTKQRFFGQILIGMKLPSLIPAIRRDETSGAETEILRLETEERYKPVPLDRALRILGDDARPLVNRKSGRAAIRCSTYSLTDDDGEIVRRYELVRPTRSERMRQDLLLETMWEETSEAEFSALWQAEVEEMRNKTRTSTLYLVAGLLLPVWDRLPDDHVQVWRLNTDDGQSFLGRIVPAPLVSKLADAFGINAAITVSVDDTAKHVMTTGEISSVGAYRLKRSLVAGQQRLELLDWPHTRLAELKAAGCFTDIIQHRTRMFVPVAHAAAVIERITA